MGRTRDRLKKAIAQSRIPSSHGIRYANELLALGAWFREHAEGVPAFARNRDLYAHVNEEVLGDAPIDLFEFGVREGSTISKWMEVNSNPASRFFGFDSFEGLPESWRGGVGETPAGSFATGGAVPRLDDERVHFVAGLFQETLSAFLTQDYRPTGNRRVLHCDADLYSSTLFVLATMHPWLDPGSVIVFDEFDSPLHEFRAFVDYTSSYRRRFRAIARTGPLLARLAVEILE